MSTSEWLTVDQFAARLQVSRSSVRGWIRSGRLKGVRRVRGSRLLRIPAVAVEEILEPVSVAPALHIVRESAQ